MKVKSRRLRKPTKFGRKNISEATLAAALRKNGGNQAAAARVLKITPAAVCKRVEKSEVLKAAIQEGRAYIGEVAIDNVVQSILDKDMVTTRWYLERRNPDYSSKRENREIPAPPDPEEEKQRQQLVQFFRAEVERRARLGLPSIFSDAETSPAQQPARQAPMIDVTPRTANGGRSLQR